MTDPEASGSPWPDEPTELLGLPAFGFADAGPVRDELTAAVLAGDKVATTSLAVDYVLDGTPLPTVGGRSVVYGSDLRPVAIVETTAWRLWTVGLVDDAFAAAEGEGYADAQAWRIAHEGYVGHLPRCLSARPPRPRLRDHDVDRRDLRVVPPHRAPRSR